MRNAPVAALALALAALLISPIVAAKAPAAAYPDEVKALLPEWIAEADAAVAGTQEKPWFAEMDRFLQKAKNETAIGRVRATVFDLETTHELVRANRLMEEAEVHNSEAERKSFVLGRTQVIHAEAEDAWNDYRAKLHALDANVQSLRALELAIYSADIALGAKVALDTHDDLAREYPKAAGFTREATLDMLRASATPLLDLGFANDILDVALAQEGLPPRLDAAKWKNYTDYETQPRTDESGRLEMWEDIAKDVRANGEGIMAVTIALAEARVARLQAISLTYGDARTRGIDVVRDAAVNMEKRLNRTSLEDVQAYGLTGVFTSDAIDQARFVLDFVAQGKANLEFITAAWANLDHQETTALVLADLSPVEPDHETNLGEQNNLTRYLPPRASTKASDAPGAPLGLALVGIALVAWALRRR